MIPKVNYFSGGLGKLKNIGGSKFFTTPHTVQVPVEYEISSGSQGEFISCSLDGRLWLFNDKVVALKWNSSSLRMEFATSMQISEIKFIARGIDWILTTGSFFQVLDNAPYIFSEHVSFNDDFTVDKFYSFLPEINGWQIINNFLVRRYGNNDEVAFRSISTPAGLYLTNLDNAIYGKDNSYIGSISIEDYQLVISPDYSISANVSGLAFLDKTLYGFRLKQDSSLCPVSEDTLVFNAQAGSWSNVFDSQDTTGNIFFDPFNCKAVAVRDDAVNLLPEKKIFTAKGISQWVAPIRKIDTVTSDFVITRLEHDILATHVNSGLYRESLFQKDLVLTCSEYSDYKLSIGRNNNGLTFNKIISKVKKTIRIKITLLNSFIHDFDWYLVDYKDRSQIPVFYQIATLYSGIDYSWPDGSFPKIYSDTYYPGYAVWDDTGQTHYAVVSSATATIFYINPFTGIPETKIFTNNPDNQSVTHVDIPRGIFLFENNLVWEIEECIYTGPGHRYDWYYKYFSLDTSPVFDYQNLILYSDDSEHNLVNKYSLLNLNTQLLDITNQNTKAVFKEFLSNTSVIFDIPPEYLTDMNHNWDKSLGSIYFEIQNYINIKNTNEALHVVIFQYPIGREDNKEIKQNFFLVFKSELQF